MHMCVCHTGQWYAALSQVKHCTSSSLVNLVQVTGCVCVCVCVSMCVCVSVCVLEHRSPLTSQVEAPVHSGSGFHGYLSNKGERVEGRNEAKNS